MKTIESDMMQELASLLVQYFENVEMIRFKNELKNDPYEKMLNLSKSPKKNKKRKK